MRPERLLYPHQADLIAGYSGRDDYLVEWATGAGKTTAAVALMTEQVVRRGRFTHGIVATSQVVIEDGFLPEVDVAFRFEGKARPRAIVAGPGTIRRAGASGRSVAAVLAYLADPAPKHVLTCTHHALGLAFKATPGLGLGRAVLFLDEAHHVGAGRLGRAVDAWSAAGGRLIFATATPYRADGRPVARPGMIVHRRTLAEQMEGGRFAPEHVAHGIIPIGRPGDAVTRAEFTGAEVSGERRIQEEFAEKMVEHFRATGCPKTVVCVPVLRGGSRSFVELLARRLAEVEKPDGSPVRVLDATGESRDDQRRVLDAIRADRGRGFAESEVDIIIGIQRVCEGMDWPHCSTVFCVGIPGSMAGIIQRLGRATRKKGLDHDPRHRDRAMIRFFVPGAGKLDDYDPSFSRHALTVCACLADYDAAGEMALVRIVRAAGQGAGKGEGTVPNPGQVATVKAIMAAEVLAAEAAGEEPTVGRLVDAAKSKAPEIPMAVAERVAAGLLATDPETEADVAGRLHRELAARFASPLDAGPAIEGAFAAVIEEFRDATLHAVGPLRDLASRFHHVAGVQLREWVGRLGPAMVWDLDAAAEAAQVIFAATGRWPGSSSNEHANPGRSFRALDQYFFKAGLGSVGRFLDERLPQLRLSCPVDADQLATSAWAFYGKFGRWPNCKDVTEALPGWTWQKINNHFRFTKMLSLSAFLDARFPTYRSNTAMDLDAIASSAQAFFESNGRLPIWTDKVAIDGPASYLTSIGKPATWANVFWRYKARKGSVSLSDYFDQRFPELRRKRTKA